LIELESKWVRDDEAESARGSDKPSPGSGPAADPIHLQIFYDEELEPSGDEGPVDAEPSLDSPNNLSGSSILPEQGDEV
jgi:hypothetical protein